MKKKGDTHAHKIDVIMHGHETIGSAERSSNADEMRESFYTISEGKYAEKLFELFGKERVEAELNEFLGLEFFPRVGGGIGMTRIMNACEKHDPLKGWIGQRNSGRVGCVDFYQLTRQVERRVRVEHIEANILKAHTLGVPLVARTVCNALVPAAK